MDTAEERLRNRSLLNYERLKPGAELGRATLCASAERLATWRALFPGAVHGGGIVPPGLLAVLMMRAFSEEVAPRLPDFAVAGHDLRWGAQPVRCSETLAVTFHCLGKETRPDGRRIEVEAVMLTESGTLVFEGEISLVDAGCAG